MGKYVDGLHFDTEECSNCGIAFAMTADFKRRRLNDRALFYCPAGHAQHYTGKSEAEKLKAKLAEKQRQLEAESGRAALLAQQRDASSKSYGRIRERVKNGVCPCCNRQFQNLLQHMRTKHKDFGDHEALKALRDAYGLTQSALADEIGIPSQYISNYEHEKPAPAYAVTQIDQWMAGNA